MPSNITIGSFVRFFYTNRKGERYTREGIVKLIKPGYIKLEDQTDQTVPVKNFSLDRIGMWLTCMG